MFWTLLIENKSYSWLSKFEFTPFFWVWVLSALVWFFLEISVWAAQYFNSKHTYASEVARATIFLIQVLKLLKNKKKNLFLTIAYANIL